MTAPPPPVLARGRLPRELHVDVGRGLLETERGSDGVAVMAHDSASSAMVSWQQHGSRM
jgi:hypothetical protein